MADRDDGRCVRGDGLCPFRSVHDQRGLSVFIRQRARQESARGGGETVLVEIDGHMPVLDPDRHLLPYLGVPDPGFALTVTMPSGVLRKT